MTLLNNPQQVPVKSSKPVSVFPVTQIEPKRHRWTPEEVYKMVEAGILPEQTGCELIDGDVIDMAPQYNPHAASISWINRLLVAAFDESYWLTVQSTVRLPRGDLPEPDFAVRPGPVSTDNSVHPLPLLVIEVSDSTLLYDQVSKSSMYAANGVHDCWIVNLIDRRVEVYREPVQDASRRHGFGYASVQLFAAGESVSPLAAPGVSLAIDQMLR